MTGSEFDFAEMERTKKDIFGDTEQWQGGLRHTPGRSSKEASLITEILIQKNLLKMYTPTGWRFILNTWPAR